MTAILDKLIETLRNELQHYGEMLALLDQQQALASQSCSESIQPALSAVDAQSNALQTARKQRQAAQRRLASALNRAENSSLIQLIPSLPAEYRPLITALLQENNELYHRVGQRAQQNQRLLQRSLELMKSVMTSFPGAARGRLLARFPRSSRSKAMGLAAHDAPL